MRAPKASGKSLPLSDLQRKFHKLIRATPIFDDVFYARNNPDVAAEYSDLLQHYIATGERENRAPSVFFDPTWYRLQVARVPADHCLLAHYLTIGDADGIQPMVGFDPGYVREKLGTPRTPALVGFLNARAEGSRVNPNRFFDYDWYLAANPDVAAVGIDAYYHFVQAGANEGRLPSEDFSWYDLRERYHLAGTNSEVFRALMLRWRHLNLEAMADETPAIQSIQDDLRANHRPSEYYEPHAASAPEGSRRKCDVYAYYLTQFHRVAENDAWWGEGFTEWHNVVRGAPRFAGHYQPRIPSALGFYDLDDPRVFPRQVALARQAGLAGFAFYYYHFGDRRLLEKPLERFLADPSLDLGFFLIWANETWSRRWDGSESEVLIEQSYPPDFPETIAADLARHFADPRYRRIGGRALVAIYRAGAIPEGAAWLDRLRAAFRALGEDPLIYMAQTFEDEDPGAYGLDGALEFPPHKHSRTLPLAMPARGYGTNPMLKVWDYDQFVDAAIAEPWPAYPMIRACFPSWDNDSRRQGASSVIHGSTPEKFRRWLAALVVAAEQRGAHEPIVCINAWNEWGEGAYLEPDRRFGHAYLNTVQSVLHPEDASHRRLLLVGHDAFAAGAQRLLLNLGRLLKQEFGVDVAFLLLRADRGYDGLLDAYRGVAETHVADGNIDTLIARLRARGFVHAIVNSSASAPALEPLAASGIALIQLVHELPGVFDALGAGPAIAMAAGHVRRFVASTRTVAAMIERVGVSPARIAVLPQGQYRRVSRADPRAAREQLQIGPDRCLVVGLGYGDVRKGVDLFAAVAEAALDADPTMDFIWQGDWDPGARASLADRVERLVASGRFRHLPDGPDIETLLGAADVYFLPSREDPLPSVAIEAWSCGLPVAAIRGTGGIADLIAEHRDLGALASGTDTPELLATVRAAAALGRGEARATWATAQFDWPSYARALLRELYQPPVVDVAIIGHNHGRFAEPRISSIVRQTLPARAIRYLDMESSDGSPALVGAVAQRLGVGLVEAAGNDGRLFQTWYEVAAASDAPYIQIAEGDDWIAPTMIEQCVARLEATRGAAYAFTAVEWIDADDRVIADHRNYPPSVIGWDYAGGGEISAEALLGSDFVVKNPVLTVSSVVWRREILLDLLDRHRLALTYLSFAFDWLLYLRAARAGYSAVFVADLLCRHRQHHDSFASRDDLGRHAREIARIYELEPAPDAADARDAYLATLE
ncbi:MAG: glycoside hydrolase family 99-like domain-containing protein [Sphingomonas sp.]